MSIVEHEYYQRWYRTVWERVPLKDVPLGEYIMERAWELGYRTVGEAEKWIRGVLQLGKKEGQS